MYQCKELLDKITTTPIRVQIQGKEYQLYYHQGTLSNHINASKCEAIASTHEPH